MRIPRNRSAYKLVIYAVFSYIFVINNVFAQQFTAQTDPRPILGQLIQAFQTCSQPQVFQYLGVFVYQSVASQTNGTGCYPNIAAAGPVTNMQVINVNQLPVGPVFAVRVSHQSGTVADWYIGLSNVTNKVEYLTFVAANMNAPLPDAHRGPVGQDGKDRGQIPQPAQAQPPPDDAPSECKVFKTMCQ